MDLSKQIKKKLADIYDIRTPSGKLRSGKALERDLQMCIQQNPIPALTMALEGLQNTGKVAPQTLKKSGKTKTYKMSDKMEVDVTVRLLG